MKNSKLRRALLLVACAVMLVSVSVSATLAYLTSKTEVVTNTFSVGKVKITLDEADVDDTDNDGNKTERDTVNNYHLLPNDVHDKDPIVWLDKESEDCFLFVKVVNPLSPIEANTTEKPSIKTQMETNGWKQMSEGSDIYYYADADGNPKSVKAADVQEKGVPVFTKVYISANAHNDETKKTDPLYLATYEGKQITVTAYAIQADGWTNPTAAKLWQDGGFNQE